MNSIVIKSLVVGCLLLVTGAPFVQAAPPDPESATGTSAKAQAQGKRYMVVSANPLATRAGEAVLAEGGSAVDAAIAVQFMLGLVEPQSSGIGGGLFLLHWSDKAKQLDTLDGRETAPAAATPQWFMQADGKVMDWRRAYVGGRSVGAPGAVRALEMAHRRWGRLPWARLLAPAIEMAERGFAVSPRLHGLLVQGWNAGLKNLPAASDYFYPQGQALAVGQLRDNKPYAALLRRLAREGEAAFYTGENARALVDAVNQSPINPGQMTEADLAQYQPLWREALCAPYRVFRICSMAPPSSGGLAVLQILGLLEGFDLAAEQPNSEQAVHWISQASRLAFADRERFVADPAFSPVPAVGLLDREYLKRRAQLIDSQRDAGEAPAGEPPGAQPLVSAQSPEFENTSHVSVVDGWGQAVSMTTSIENAFGSGLMVNGYLLNNQLTDFSLVPQKGGYRVANRVEAGKRPRSSMAPMMVFDAQGQLQMIAGSPGGSRIINYVAHALVAMIDWNLGPQAAADLPKFGHRNDSLALEAGTVLARAADSFRARGHRVQVTDMNSGLHLIQRRGELWLGGADPRREGVALGR
jgi:gamma-glutamyltranspeptidase/glutathione hydrolase